MPPLFEKVGKTTRPFRYDLNQIPYDYTVDVTNRFKGLDLIDRVPEELWMKVHNIVSVQFSSVTQSCPTFCDPMDCSPPDFSVHAILQARILEWIAISFSRARILSITLLACEMSAVVW